MAARQRQLPFLRGRDQDGPREVGVADGFPDDAVDLTRADAVDPTRR